MANKTLPQRVTTFDNVLVLSSLWVPPLPTPEMRVFGVSGGTPTLTQSWSGFGCRVEGTGDRRETFVLRERHRVNRRHMRR